MPNRRVFLLRAQIPSKLSVPGRHDDRDRAVCLGLTSETNQGFRLGSIDVAELFGLFSFARTHVGKFFRAAKYADPARTARSRAAFDGDRSFNAPRINSAPVARTIVGGAPGKVLAFV